MNDSEDSFSIDSMIEDDQDSNGFSSWLDRLRHFRAIYPKEEIQVFFRKLSSAEIQAFDNESITELLCLDLIQQQHKGMPAPVENYIQPHPEVNITTQSILDLIDSEVAARTDNGDVCTAREYHKRFPDLKPEIDVLFAIHDLESSGDEDETADFDEIEGYQLIARQFHDSNCSFYRARDNKTKDWVGIYVISLADFSSDFLDSISPALDRMIGKKHPTLATLQNAFAINNQLVFVSDWIEGILFSELNGQTIESSKLLRYLDRILLALLTVQELVGEIPTLEMNRFAINHQDEIALLNLGVEDFCTRNLSRILKQFALLIVSLASGNIYRSSIAEQIDQSEEFAKAVASCRKANLISADLVTIISRCISSDSDGYRSLDRLANDISNLKQGKSIGKPLSWFGRIFGGHRF